MTSDLSRILAYNTLCYFLFDETQIASNHYLFPYCKRVEGGNGHTRKAFVYTKHRASGYT